MKFVTNTPYPNYLLNADGFFISYNPNPCADMGIFRSDDGQSETALCVDGKFFILNGDYRKEYEELAPKGVMACLEFFYKNEESRSSWSSGTDVITFISERMKMIGGAQ